MSDDDDEIIATEMSQISAPTQEEGGREVDLQTEKVLEKWEEDPTFRTRTNTPGKKVSKSPVWASIKRLCDDHPLAEEFTHICILKDCKKRFMTLLKPFKKDYYTTTKALKHIRMYHHDAPENLANLTRSNIIHVSIGYHSAAFVVFIESLISFSH